MKAIEPKLHNVNLGKDQEEFITLPAYIRLESDEKTVITAFKLSDEELERIQQTKTIYVGQQTYGRGFHPIMVSLEESEIYTIEELTMYAEKQSLISSSPLVEFESMCGKCGKRTQHTMIDLIESDEREINIAVGECRECGTHRQDFITDLLSGSTPEERTRMVTEEWEKDNDYRPYCGNCFSVIRMFHMKDGWRCASCGAVGMREVSDE